MCGNYCPFTVNSDFQTLPLPHRPFQLEKQFFCFGCPVCGNFFPAFFAVLIGILAVYSKNCIFCIPERMIFSGILLRLAPIFLAISQ
jgi:hypothetical protein